MLDKLEAIANELDNKGMHKEADAVTGVMTRIAHFWNKHEGPIQDFSGNADFEAGREFGTDKGPFDLGGAISGDNMEMMGIHSVLRNAGIDPSGLDDNAARQVYQAIMGAQVGQMGHSYAETNSKFKRIG